MAGTATYPQEQENQGNSQQRGGGNARQQGGNREGGQVQNAQQNAAQRDYQQLVRDIANSVYTIDEARQTAILKAVGKTKRDLQADVQQAKQPQR